MDPKAASGKQHNQHPCLVLNHLIKKYTYNFWGPIRFLKIYLICSSNGFTNTLTPQIYKIESCVLHLQQIRISKETKSQEKNCRSVVSTLVKLSVEFQPCQSRGANFTHYAHKINTCPNPPVSNGFYVNISNQHHVPFTDFQICRQKLGDILENRMFRNLKLSKNSNIKQHYSKKNLNEKKWERFRCFLLLKVDFKNKV